jgi:predicted aspartyl protease
MLSINDTLHAIKQAHRLTELKSLRTKGTLDYAGTAGEIETIIDFQRLCKWENVSIPPVTRLSANNENEIWQKDMNGKIYTNADSESIADRVVNLQFDNYDYLFHPDRYSFSMTGNTIEIVSKKHSDTSFGKATITFDKQTYFITSLQSVSDGEVCKTEYRDYKLFDGIFFPVNSHTNSEVGTTSSICITEATFNKAIDPSIFSTPSQDVKDYDFLNNAQDTTIKLHRLVRHIAAEVTTDNQHYSLVVDTGAMATCISNEWAEHLNLEKGASIEAGGISGTQTVQIVTLPDLRVGEIKMKSQKVFSTDFNPARKKGLFAEGLLGQDFLNRFVVRFDYVKNEMRVYERESFTYSGNGQRFELDGNYFTMRVDGTEGKFNIDTGAGEIALHTHFAKKLISDDAKSKLPSVSAIAGIGSTKLTSYRSFSKRIEVGNFHFENVPVDFSDIDKGAFTNQKRLGNVGGIFWEKFISYFDFTDNWMILEPNVNFHDPFRTNKSGLGLSSSNDGMVVDAITTLSPAFTSGFQVGDTLLSIDGATVESLGLLKLTEKFHADSGTTYSIEVLSGSGEKKTIPLTLKEYRLHYDSV